MGGPKLVVAPPDLSMRDTVALIMTLGNDFGPTGGISANSTMGKFAPRVVVVPWLRDYLGVGPWVLTPGQ